MVATETYNGWKNYETWNVALWIGNEEGSYKYWQNQTRRHIANAPKCPQVCDGIWTAAEAARFTLADTLKSEISDSVPDLGASMWADLLGAALSEVDWVEIATNWIDDLE